MMELSLSVMLMLILGVSGSAHPLVFCLSLVFFSLTLSLVINIILSKWVMYAIILIFLGGMMVIFIYMTTLASNEKLLAPTYLNSLLKAGLPPMFSLAILGGLTIEKSFSLISHPFTSPSSPVIFFLVVYLLMTLFIVVSISKSFKGALIKFS